MMGLDLAGSGPRDGVGKRKGGKGQKSKGKGQGPRKGARKADASRPRFVAFSHLEQKVKGCDDWSADQDFNPLLTKIATSRTKPPAAPRTVRQ